MSLHSKMTVNAPHLDVKPVQASLPPVARNRIDWLALRRAPHSCCCLARPVVIAVMSPAEGRPHPTELLLCGHHYRASRRALAAARARVLDFDGAPVAGAEWPASPGQP
jgi:hypothetical protein